MTSLFNAADVARAELWKHNLFELEEAFITLRWHCKYELASLIEHKIALRRLSILLDMKEFNFAQMYLQQMTLATERNTETVVPFDIYKWKGRGVS